MMQAVLESICQGRVCWNVPMAAMTTIGVGGPADALVEPEGEEELIRLLRFLAESQIPYLVLGLGSNLLVQDGGFRGVIIRPRVLVPSPEVIRDHRVRAEAGVPLIRLIHTCARLGLRGLENLAGIPGSLGGAVVMNAGAHGSRLGDTLKGARIIAQGGSGVWLDRETIRPEYRRTALPEGGVVTVVILDLEPGDPQEILKVVDQRMDHRKRAHPLDLPSAGSFFKNPPLAPAGMLIEACGLKGLRFGGAEVSRKHANFLVNVGGARASDFIGLARRVQREVEDRFGVSLEMEVRVIGVPLDDEGGESGR